VAHIPYFLRSERVEIASMRATVLHSVSVDLDQIADPAVLAQSVNPFCKNIKVLEPW